MPPRYICIHGHFYQPPRENPWLGAIEAQESASPYHDWNERITAECYAPNARCRILDGHGRITQIVNNYAKISFNFGPTLLSWLEAKSPETYAAILEADRLGLKQFGGHGPAIAQVYNHIIMPLANERDRRTQVLWGLADFRQRFGRNPEGMWLAETAADTPTLELLAAEGIVFTILSPFQAKEVRAIGELEWTDVSGGKVDPYQPYLAELPSGKSLALFFYDGPMSQAIAFEGLLKSGEKFAARLLGGLNPKREGPQLVHVATDGETYGHHHAHGDMALAYALRKIEAGADAKLTVYGQFLKLHPPIHEARLIEPSSWSCSHGVERWRSHCGCAIGGREGWTQAWRGPLRQALDMVRDKSAPAFEAGAGRLLADPWAARDDYPSAWSSSPATFLYRHAGRELSPAEAGQAIRWLEQQRQCLLMYTSCGWFFDELSGIETVQIMAYAARALQLLRELTGEDFVDEFRAMLQSAKSNVPHWADGGRIFDKLVRPLEVDLARVAAHFAVSSLFEEYGEEARLDQFMVRFDNPQIHSSGGATARLALGRLTVTSVTTQETGTFDFAAVHLGDLNLRGGVKPTQGVHDTSALVAAFQAADYSELLHMLDRDYAAARHSLKAVFRDEQRTILDRMLATTSAALEATYRQVYVSQAPTMMFLQGLDTPLLPAFRHAAQFVINLDLRRAFDQREPDLETVERLTAEAELWSVQLDTAGLSFSLKSAVARMIEDLHNDPHDPARMSRCVQLLEIVESLQLSIDYWQAQNDYYLLRERVFKDRQAKAAAGDSASEEWLASFRTLGAKLRVS